MEICVCFPIHRGCCRVTGKKKTKGTEDGEAKGQFVGLGRSPGQDPAYQGWQQELWLLFQQLREDRENWSRAREGLGRTKVPPKRLQMFCHSWGWAAGGDRRMGQTQV